MGRTPWSDKRTVEECRTLSISRLAKRKFYLFEGGHPQSFQFSFTSGFRMEVIYPDRRSDDPEWTMRLCFGFPGKWECEHTVQFTSIPSPLRRGKRYYFKCPGIQYGVRCDRRVGKLYLPPGEDCFACRKCHDLTYESVKEHDWRVDALRKLSLEQVAQLLQCPDARMSLLALK